MRGRGLMIPLLNCQVGYSLLPTYLCTISNTTQLSHTYKQCLPYLNLPLETKLLEPKRMILAIE